MNDLTIVISKEDFEILKHNAELTAGNRTVDEAMADQLKKIIGKAIEAIEVNR